MKYRFNDEKKKHLHELDTDGTGYRPLYGTTTLLNEVFPPPLAWWGSRMALEPFGFTTEKVQPDMEKRMALAFEGQKKCREAANMNVEEYYDFLTSCYRAHDEYKKAKGKEGIDKHSLIENYIKNCIEHRNGKPTDENIVWEGIEGFTTWARKDVERFLWSEAHCYSKELWTGGITDFGFIHKNGKFFIGDNKPSVYPKNFMQTAGYGIQIRENGLVDKDGNTLTVDLNGSILSGYCIFDYNKGEAWYRNDVERLERFFRFAVDFYVHKDIIGTNIPE